MSGHIQNVVSSCPNTRLVPGGYSLGAAVTDVVLAVRAPVFGFTSPLPPGSDEHIAAVALFGNGTQWVGPIANFNPAYSDRTIEMCHGADPICNPADPNTWQPTGRNTKPTDTSRPAWSTTRLTSSPENCNSSSRLPLPDERAQDGGVRGLSRTRRERAMKANVGDYLVVKGTTVERHEQHAEIIEVRSKDGSPPYVVRWLATGHEVTVYPGSDAVVVTAAEHTDAAQRAAARAGHAAT
jgi:Cutinase/Domain of unknown function (DUF1918)